jgi:hypothetical protein
MYISISQFIRVALVRVSEMNTNDPFSFLDSFIDPFVAHSLKKADPLDPLNPYQKQPFMHSLDRIHPFGAYSMHSVNPVHPEQANARDHFDRDLFGSSMGLNKYSSFKFDTPPSTYLCKLWYFTLTYGSMVHGHWMRHCPLYRDKKAMDNSNVPPVGYICRKCNVPGHWIQQCPYRPHEPPEYYLCRICGIKGHWIQQCPFKKHSADFLP